VWNLKVHYHVCRQPPLVPYPEPDMPVHTTSSHLSKIHYNIIPLPTSMSFWQSLSYMHSSSPPYVLQALSISSSLASSSNYTWRRGHVTKLIITQLFPKLLPLIVCILQFLHFYTVHKTIRGFDTKRSKQYLNSIHSKLVSFIL
jgi:hypothetical protein